MIKIIVLFLSLLTVPAAAQSVQQSPIFVTPGHAAYWVTNGVLGDAGTAQNPAISSIGTIGQGSTICANSGVNTGPYNQLCLATNLASAAQIILQNFGSAAAQTLQFVINGTTYTFPFSTTGIVGPGTTVSGDAVCWNNTVGTLVSDCGVPVSASSTITFTNKTLTSSTNSLGGVTAAFGSDAKGDIYTNGGSSNVITRLGIGTAGQCLVPASSLPSWGSCLPSGVTSASTGQLALALGTITTNIKAISITGTWNAGGVTFDAPIFENITNTASAAGSLLIDLQTGGASEFTVSALGAVSISSTATSANPSMIHLTGVAGDATSPNNGTGGAWILGFNTNTGNKQFWFGDFDFSGSSTKFFTRFISFANHTYWNSVTGDGTGTLPFFVEDLNVLSWGALTTARKIQVYNTTDSTFSNYERAAFDWTTSANVLTIGTQNLGSGSVRNIQIVVGGTDKLDYGVTTSATWTLTDALNAPNIASLAANTTAYVCWTTGTGAISHDSTTCLASLGKFKKNILPFANASAELIALKPFTFEWKQPQDRNQQGRQLGFIAEDVAAVDPKLASFSSDGSLHGWQEEGMIALLVKGFQEQQAEIEQLKRKIH